MPWVGGASLMVSFARDFWACDGCNGVAWQRLEPRLDIQGARQEAVRINTAILVSVRGSRSWRWTGGSWVLFGG